MPEHFDGAQSRHPTRFALKDATGFWFPPRPSLCQDFGFFFLCYNRIIPAWSLLSRTKGEFVDRGWRIFAPSPIETMACRVNRSKPPNFDNSIISDQVLRSSISYLNRPHLQYSTEQIAKIEARNYVSMLLLAVRFLRNAGPSFVGPSNYNSIICFRQEWPPPCKHLSGEVVFCKQLKMRTQLYCVYSQLAIYFGARLRNILWSKPYIASGSTHDRSTYMK